ncbi:MAG: sulfur-carrier protein adenylyltransferase/sulfurtransferase [Acidobacteriota bacterium]|jgi:adenylyltransferase/sulfurtransferase|nr:sulfur-carrier protein adenylyltransferase/sulfurtransferase [Acidobacteriota bacterium]
MLSDSERARYARHLILPELGERGQLALKRGSVLIIGAGGLGSPAAMYLAAAGVGRIGLVDFDVVDASNLHRQLLYGSSDVGRPKLEAARERLHDINGEIAIETHPFALMSDNALELFAKYDVIIDGTDNFPTRYLVSDACTLLGKPNVYGSIFRFEGQVSVFDDTRGPCYRCLYPTPPPPALVPNCAEAGVLGVLPGIIGSLQANEAIKLIAGIGEPLIGRLLLFDALALRFREVRVTKQPHERVTHLIDYEGFCNPMDINVIELAERIGRGDALTLLDVREPHEWNAGHLENALHIPMQQIQARVAEVPREAEIIVYCRMGGRSARVQQFLQQQGFASVRNLAGGMLAWQRDVDPSMKVV